MQDTDKLMPPLMMEAIYRPAAVPEHRGNPLIEALPPFIEAKDIEDKFGRYPVIADSERLLPKTDRMLLISRLNNYLEPLPSHFDVIEKIHIIVRAGYGFRNPLDQNMRKARTKYYRESMEGKICPIGDSGPSTAPSFALFGPSGIGKSTIADRSLTFLPQVLLHREHKFTQVVWLKIDCPLDGSLKQLLQGILAKLDTLLGSTYLKQVGQKRTVDELMLSVAKIMAMHHVGVLVIDEIQNLLDANGVGQAKMLNFFVTFANEVRIPVITIGTPRALSMLTGTFREARRVGDHGTCIWDALDEKEWNYFIESLWNYQWTAKFVPLTQELKDVMHEESQGIHALVVRLFQLTQLQAIRDESECLTKELINKVAKNKFKLVRPMLDAIKSNNKKALELYQDLLDKGIKEIAKNLELDTKLALLKAGTQKRNQECSERIRTISVLVAMKHEENQVQEIVTALFNTQPDLSCDRAVKIILDTLHSSMREEPSSQSLMDIVKATSSNASPAEALESAGFMTSKTGGN